MSTPIIKLVEVTKRFPGVTALDRVSLEIYKGEILGLVGENGAGKSTLMKILSGVFSSREYDGQILWSGQVVSFQLPSDAESAGIAIIHQELANFQHLTVAENLFIGHWPLVTSSAQNLGVIDWEKLNTDAKYWLDMVGANCKPDDLVADLSIGTQQLVEIAKALSRKSEILILDEPTSSLTPHESSHLIRLMKDLRANGKALVFISHKMDEVFELCDRLVVLRDGHTVHATKTADITLDGLVGHMVGRQVKDIYPASPERKRGPVILDVKNLVAKIEGHRDVLGPVNLQIHAGEILGIGGLLGAGRSELLKAILGDYRATILSGEIFVEGRKHVFQNPQAALDSGLSYVSEDRKGESILPQRSLMENASISKLTVRLKKFLIDANDESSACESRLNELNTRFANINQEIVQLSGGNQQKVIIARAMETDSRLIILDEPTRGIDVLAKKEIYEIIFKLAVQGKAILLISSDLPELMALSDRIAMMKNGQIQGLVMRKDFTQKGLMRLAFGV
jgi:ABC-type sugar transport system ATPase subunit